MKFSTILSCSAAFLATLVAANMPNDPTKVDTCIMPGVVAYTIDDGPAMYNDKLLEILARKNVTVTFFVLGRMIALNGQQAGAIKKIYDAGHQLASHTYSHSNMDRMTVAQMQKEIRDTDALLLKYAGVRPRYMRAPEGRCGEPCTKAMNDMGLIVSHWNVDTNDWRFAHQDPKRATRNSMVEINDVIIKGSDPKKDSFILLQHELLKFSVELLVDRVIDAILKKGYRFVTMEECIGRPAYIGQPRSPVPDPTTDLTPQPTSVEPTPQPTSTIGTKNIVADNENEDIEISSNNDTSVEPNVANDVKSQDQKNGSAAVAHGALLTWATTFVAALSMF